MQITNLKQNVDLIETGQKSIYLVGTAHVSQASTELVDQVIREISPSSVAVELCESRFKSLRDPDRWKNTDLVSVIRTGRASVLLAQLMLMGFQKRLGKKLKVQPGAEMMRAIEVAEQQRCQTVLADRDVRTTLKRTWASLGFWNTCKLPFVVASAMSAQDEISEEEIERLKSSDGLEALMKDFSESFPAVKSALIDERDRYLAAKIRSAPGSKIVAVVGAGHVPGIKRFIGEEIDLRPLEEIPPKSMTSRVVGLLLPSLVIGLIIAGFFSSGVTTSKEMVLSWIWITGLSAALGSAICLAHPLTIVSAFLSAPITTLHPLLASGWIAGLVEAILRKPRVSDLETIGEDITSVKGLWRNRVSRTLMIVALTNLSGSVGMLLGAKAVASLL